MPSVATPGEVYCNGTLVRVVAPHFVAGLIIDPVSQRVVIAAPILNYLRGQHADKLRQTFKRLGWKATIVKRSAP
jgi:hypothetical protein